MLLQKEDKDPPGEQNKAAFPKMLGVAASNSGCQDASQDPKAPIGDRLTQMPSVARLCQVTVEINYIFKSTRARGSSQESI